MRRKYWSVPIVVLVVAQLAVAAGASAAPTAGTPITFEVTGGALNISAPVAAVSLGSVAISNSAQLLSAPLGVVTVTDGRGGTTGWTATASATDFVGPSIISMSAVGSSSYVTPIATVTGQATVAPTNLTSLYPGGPVQVATGVAGINTADWNPTLSVTVPANTIVGSYSTTLTHSVF